MKAGEIQNYARQLFEQHGSKAIAEAAQKALSFEEAGDDAQARTWRQIELALKERRGAHES